MHYINKLINPVVELQTEEELVDFLDLNKEPNETSRFFKDKQVPLGKEYSDKKTKTRVVAFIFEKDEFKEELKNLRAASRYSGRRFDLRMGVVYDKKIIKKYKAKHGNWFPEVTYSTIILKRHDGQIFTFDLINENPALSLSYWINK